MSANHPTNDAIRAEYRNTCRLPNVSPLRRRTYVLAITNRCNLECPLCYASASSRGYLSMPLDRIRTLAQRVKADGGQRLSLSGGEPTLHPDILEIIHMVRHDVGLQPVIMTNGLRIAEEPDFAQSMKKAGLSRVHLQFDTLCNETYQNLRGRQDVTEKTLAIQHTIAGGLRLGLITTVSSRNLGEVGGLLDYAITLVPALRAIRFQTAVPVGRFPSGTRCVTREEILSSLVRSSVRCRLQPSDFTTSLRPGLVPMCAHPDCGVHVLMHVDGSDAVPWTRRRSSPDRRNPTSRDACRRHEGDASAKEHFMIASIVSFMRPGARDERRLRQCVAASVTEQGLVSICERACTGASTPFSGPYETGGS